MVKKYNEEGGKKDKCPTMKKNVAKKSKKEEYVRQQIGDKERASY